MQDKQRVHWEGEGGSSCGPKGSLGDFWEGRVRVRGDSLGPHLLCPFLILPLYYLSGPPSRPPAHISKYGHLTLFSASILFPHISHDDFSTDFLQVTKVHNITVIFIPSPFLSSTSKTLLILCLQPRALLTYIPAQAQLLLFNQPRMPLLSGFLHDSSAPPSDRDALSSSELPTV